LTKITIERNALWKSLSHTQRVVERRNTYPILANVLIEAGGNGITLRATDLDIEVTENVPATVDAPFVTTVPAHTLTDIVKKMPDGCEVTIENAKEAVVVKGGRSRFSLATISADSFPDLKSGTFTAAFSMPAADLRALIERTQFAISTEETRYYLNGIFVHFLEDAGVLRAVATDGHRMARTEIPCPPGAEKIPSVIVPRKTVGEILRLIDDATDEVYVEISDSKIRVTLGDVVLLSKLIEGTFPDYERVTPKNNDKRLLLDRKGLATMVDRVGTLASDRGGKAVKLSISEGTIQALVTNTDHGDATEDMPADWEHDNFEIGFNTRYLADILSQITTDTVQFQFSDMSSPSLISAPDDTSTVYVLMPMRVS
jgi:DNA polymerase-3 subunit beta